MRVPSIRIDGLDPLLTMERLKQLVATHGNGLRRSQPFLAFSQFATGCDRLQPLGSLKAHNAVVCCGYGTGISVVAVLLVAARAIYVLG
jgi:hypothetical protein